MMKNVSEFERIRNEKKMGTARLVFVLHTVVGIIFHAGSTVLAVTETQGKLGEYWNKVDLTHVSGEQDSQCGFDISSAKFQLQFAVMVEYRTKVGKRHL